MGCSCKPVALGRESTVNRKHQELCRKALLQRKKTNVTGPWKPGLRILPNQQDVTQGNHIAAFFHEQQVLPVRQTCSIQRNGFFP